MSNESRSAGRARPGAGSSHHISSIAHLFFDNSAEVDASTNAPGESHLLVVGTGRDTSAPYTAVGLGQHLLDQSTNVGEGAAIGSAVPIRHVFFAEPTPVCFSGVSHLQGGSFRPPVSGEAVPWPVRRNVQSSVYRIFPGEVPSEDFSGGMVDRRFFIRHLDLPREAELGALETLAATGGTTSLGKDGFDGLIWCVQSSAAVSLSLVGRLGRLMRIINPSRIYLLIYPELGPGGASGKSEATQALATRSQRLLEYVAGESVVRSLLMGGSPEERAVQLAALARQISV